MNHGLVLRKVHRVIKFNQNAWQKPYTDMNTDLRIKAKNDCKKGFLSWWIIQFLEKLQKMWENREILNLLQQKGEETIWCQNQIVILQSFSHNVYQQ